jgi:predicted esterase
VEGVKYLRSRSDVREIGLIGHSEGALIAPMVALQSKDIAFVVLLARPGLPGDAVLKLQGTAILRTNFRNNLSVCLRIDL